MEILHDQLSSFKEEKAVPVQREFFLENMKESTIKSQRKFTSEMKDVLIQNICDDAFSLSQNDENSEAVA